MTDAHKTEVRVVEDEVVIEGYAVLLECDVTVVGYPPHKVGYRWAIDARRLPGVATHQLLIRCYRLPTYINLPKV